MADNTQPQNTEVPANETAPTVPEGVQRRIDELVAEKGNLERQYNEMKLKYENTAAAVAASLGVQPANTPPSVNPEIAETVKAVMGPYLQEIRQTLGGLRQSEQHRLLQESFAQTNAPDPVKKRAQELYAEYAKKGIYLKEDVARRQAWGEIAEQEHLKAIQATANRQNFNQPYGNLGGGGNGLPMASVNTIEKPSNFDSLPVSEQVAWYQKNVGDRPL